MQGAPPPIVHWKKPGYYESLGESSLADWLRENHKGRAPSDIVADIEAIVGHRVPVGRVRVACHRLGLQASDQATLKAVEAGKAARAGLSASGGSAQPGWPPSQSDRSTGRTGVEFVEGKNLAEARSAAGQIQTLEQLIEACKVDLDVWRVLDWNVRAYDGWRADTEKDLEFDEGKISGHVVSHGITTKTLWSVFAKFIRIKPEPISPTFQPLACPIKYALPVPARQGGVTNWSDQEVAESGDKLAASQAEPLFYALRNSGRHYRE